jgi:hypothetical protein
VPANCVFWPGVVCQIFLEPNILDMIFRNYIIYPTLSLQDTEHQGVLCCACQLTITILWSATRRRCSTTLSVPYGQIDILNLQGTPSMLPLPKTNRGKWIDCTSKGGRLHKDFFRKSNTHGIRGMEAWVEIVEFTKWALTMQA